MRRRRKLTKPEKVPPAIREMKHFKIPIKWNGKTEYRELLMYVDNPNFER